MNVSSTWVIPLIFQLEILASKTRTNDINCVSFDKTSTTTYSIRWLHSLSTGHKSSNSNKSGCSRWKTGFTGDWSHREMQLRDWRKERGDQSSSRLLSNASTDLDAEKLSSEESDVSFSQLTSLSARSPFVFRGFADWLLNSFVCHESMRRFKLTSVFLSPRARFRREWKK